MEKHRVEISYDLLQPGELEPWEQRLVEKACDATQTSYAPYSHFSVGAAVLLDNGVTVTGSNQENAAFPSGTCAERCAMFAANANYPDQPVRALAIAARQADGGFTAQPVTPCGACRQVLVETEFRYGRRVTVLLYGTEGVIRLASTYDLLPFRFDDTCM